MKHDELLDQLKEFYAEMEKGKLQSLGDFYHQEVTFEDPVQQVLGLEDLKSYLEHSIENVDYCHFTFEDELVNEKGGFLTWQMRFAHPKIRDGAEIVVPGVTQLKFDDDNGLIREHHDYYDMGALVYEHIPVVGWLTNKVKDRMKTS
ncbi:nuclear transport factor 2 family protein [Aliidiomarina sedimenti]|uniref:Nuclear transport factor 2 family protein n=1 Tax=Aliidiomarina sedimenti TaxID=1933879 RepID=A0ABY0C1D9_9GAMM|nr:nuclear transport factor 2 family protein [Aliidiomarina sedimenti]RUO31680.1 nuclear transport factor 2 family protein [Aliidiomarina sedimenti]